MCEVSVSVEWVTRGAPCVTDDAQLCTAAMLAAEAGHGGCLNVLRGAGANTDLERGSDGKTAMTLWRENVTSEMTKKL